VGRRGGITPHAPRLGDKKDLFRKDPTVLPKRPCLGRLFCGLVLFFGGFFLAFCPKKKILLTPGVVPKKGKGFPRK